MNGLSEKVPAAPAEKARPAIEANLEDCHELEQSQSFDVHEQKLHFGGGQSEATNLDFLDEPLCEEVEFEGIVGQSSALRRVLHMVETVANGNATVLLLGETGTGKELIARAIHNRSRRKERTFVKLNCAAIPSGLLESELFGHERGAFTGAITQKIGRLELADQGSLFLDEIGDIPLELQPKLLRVLQEREFERLGSTRTKKVDVRVVAATHRDLEEMILEKQFRSDLYYRLNVVPISIPPLRQRPEDIPLLVHHFVRQAARRMNKAIDTIPSETMDALMHYQWPGNIRELENVVERAVILSPASVLRVPLRDLQSRVTAGRDGERLQTLVDVERQHIRSILKDTRWVLSGPGGAAARLGMNRSTLYFRMKKLGIVRPWRIANLINTEVVLANPRELSAPTPPEVRRSSTNPTFSRSSNYF